MSQVQKNFIYLDKCPVCLSPALGSYKRGTFDYHNLTRDQVKITDSEYGKIWDLSRCERCRHVFANPCPSPFFIQSLYGAVEDPLYEEEAEGRVKNFSSILSILEKIHPLRGKLFDVGAATGILLREARKRNWGVEGIEASSWASRVARKKYRLPVLEGSFEAFPLPENHYTAVTMIDFIEHIPFPWEAMAKARRILIQGGTLCLVTPDIESLAAKIAGKSWWHFRPGHLGYFSLKSIFYLFRRAGFRIKLLRRYSWTFSAYYLLSRLDRLGFLLKNPFLVSLSQKIPIKLALHDSFEIYAVKENFK